MNLKQLEAFIQVAEGGSFSRAARELYLTQPTVSAHIAALERELGVRLFIRNTKEVVLSRDGSDLYRYARQMIDLERQIQERFNIEESVGKHSITIAASTIPAQYLVPRILIRFQERYPEEQIKLVETDSARVVEQIVEGAADVGFTGTVIEKRHCKYIPFYKDTLNIITPNTEKYREIRDKYGDDISWILKESIIMREEGSGTRREAERQLKRAGIVVNELTVTASIENQETIKRSVRQGMGISVLSRLATQEEVQDGRLLSFLIPGADEGRDINLVFNKNVRPSRTAERFIRIVREIYDI